MPVLKQGTRKKSVTTTTDDGRTKTHPPNHGRSIFILVLFYRFWIHVKFFRGSRKSFSTICLLLRMVTTDSQISFFESYTLVKRLGFDFCVQKDSFKAYEHVYSYVTPSEVIVCDKRRWLRKNTAFILVNKSDVILRAIWFHFSETFAMICMKWEVNIIYLLREIYWVWKLQEWK